MNARASATSVASTVSPGDSTRATTLRPSFVERLVEIVGPDGLLTRYNDRVTYECDGYVMEKSAPDAVVLPTTVEQVSAIVKLCRSEGTPITPRGAGTSLAGGTVSVGGGVVMALTRMNHILEVDTINRFAVVEPGVVNAHLTAAIKGSGLHYAPDPSSQGACTIGGNVATNSGGPHTLKYGVTVNHVVGVEMVVEDGSIVRFGGPTGDPGDYDFAGLIVGGEGTFGVVIKVWVRLTHNPESVRTLLAVFESVDQASRTISEIIAAGIVPAALEMMDRLIVEAVDQAFRFGFPLDAEAVLIIEVDGFDAGLDDVAGRIESLARSLGAREVRRARDEAERQLLWKCRKKAFGAIGRLSPSYCTQDGVVPRTKIPEMLAFIRRTQEKYSLRIANVFHAGDGNLHPIILFDEREPDQVSRTVAAGAEILNKCVELGGSVTGEHGIGVEKIDFMRKQFTDDDLDYMTEVRRFFDPSTSFNPNKLLPSGSSCVETKLPAVRRAT
jgi:glycolate oxidase